MEVYRTVYNALHKSVHHVLQIPQQTYTHSTAIWRQKAGALR